MGIWIPVLRSIFVSVLVAVGARLLSTFGLNTASEKWIGCQFIFGLGAGSSRQQAVLAMQAALEPLDFAIATPIVMLIEALGSALSILLPKGFSSLAWQSKVERVHRSLNLCFKAAPRRSETRLPYRFTQQSCNVQYRSNAIILCTCWTLGLTSCSRDCDS
ncbi:hypothetical protein K469DRAFT_297732 [Zopfia rhizophila CBS 207.26]|uniref:Uncharacterized protein n=1 Tax=Zopfia rhizophila CBS 207.26 TaxID=1314779 RepID=A0A6A6DNA7_9PEZI|nr:hypothetical protein K469DRAFT_297732 [Zopfia rhizophila CBS 207.26]